MKNKLEIAINYLALILLKKSIKKMIFLVFREYISIHLFKKYFSPYYEPDIVLDYGIQQGIKQTIIVAQNVPPE